MGKRCLAMVLYDGSAAANAKAAGSEPIDAVPLNAIAPRRRRLRLRRPLPAAPVHREAPPCLRAHILPALGLRDAAEVRFIHEKRVTSTDLDPHQNRFRIPTDGALRRLRPLLTLDELDAANLLYDPAAAAAQHQEPEPEPGKKRRKRQGMVHGGLPVRLVDLAAGPSGELLLSRWSSSHGTIVKGSGYMDYVRRCSFKENDVVEIWAFKQREFRLLGKTIFHGSALHVLVVKRDDARQHGCRYCCSPAPAHCLE
jgi:hypothetical protein